MRYSRLAAVSFALSTLVPLSSAAAAPAAPSSSVVADEGQTISESNSFLASPEELKAAGFSGEVITAQSKRISNLSASERSRQAALRKTESRLTAGPNRYDVSLSQPEVAAANGKPVTATSPSGGFTTMTVQRYCYTEGTENRWYRIDHVFDGGTSAHCYAGPGSYNIQPDIKQAKSLRPGLMTGRVLYRYGSATTDPIYWSTWRGPTQTTYAFSGPSYEALGRPTVFEVQISAGPSS